MCLVNWNAVLLDVCTSYPSRMLKVTLNRCIPLILVYYIIIYITKVGLVNGTRGGISEVLLRAEENTRLAMTIVRRSRATGDLSRGTHKLAGEFYSSANL